MTSDITFLFWNVNRRPLAPLVAELVREKSVDVVILAESAGDDLAYIESLSSQTGRAFHKPYANSDKIDVFTHLPAELLCPVYDDVSRRMTVRRLTLGMTDLLLVALHFPSKVNWSEHDQAGEAVTLCREVCRLEDEHGHQRTIIVGDFNMNPFERGMTSCHGFHAVMTKEIALKQHRTVLGRDYRFFYNPSWNHFGDRTTGPAGTHYYAPGKPIQFFWNHFDQLLLRPSLLPYFHDDFTVLDRCGEQTLLNLHGHPDTTIGSDHLPILFRLHVPFTAELKNHA